MKKIILSVILITLLIAPIDVFGCTSAIITGKQTKDGRPLLWKHRDTGVLENRIEYFKGLKYSFIGLVNSEDRGGIVWAGTNSEGFSIMNTASYNLKDDDVQTMDMEGHVMYQALSECRNLKDFEKMLDKMKRPMSVEANFGVIDAEGGAAYYEVNNNRWTKIDVNDPKIAPEGYLVVTNFSYTGRINDGMGYIRYNNARNIFMERAVFGDFTPQWIFSNLSRSFYHSLLDIDLAKDLDKVSGSGWFIDQDFIPRKSTSASIVIQGVNKGEDPLNTIMWTVLGYPPVSFAVPLFVKSGDDLPSYMTLSSDSENSELCDNSMFVKNKVFSLERGNGSKYFNAALLFNDKGTGYMQRVIGFENEIFKNFNNVMGDWRREGLDMGRLNTFYKDTYYFVKKLREF